MVYGALKQQLMEHISRKPYSFGQLERLDTFENRKGYELGIALRDLVRLGQIRVTQIGSMVYFRKSEGFGDTFHAKIENLYRQLFDRFRDDWIKTGEAKIDRTYPTNYIDTVLAKNTVQRSPSSWQLKVDVPNERMVAVGIRRKREKSESEKKGEIELTFDVFNCHLYDRAILEGRFYRERLQPPTFPKGSEERYLWPIALDLIGGLEFKTRSFDTYSRSTVFATNGNENKIEKITEFLRYYYKRRYPWGFKPMLQPWVIETFSNPRIGTTPKALRLKSRGFRKHQEHVDFIQYVRINELLELNFSLMVD